MTAQGDRISLGFFPTPLEYLPSLTQSLNGPKIWIKRDDQTGLGCGGNKTRKLEYLMADAIAHQADVIITAGAAQSNHCRQTAAAAAKLGLPCHLMLGGEEPLEVKGNLLLDHLFGAHIHWTGADRKGEQQEALAQEFVQQGKRPYIIPYGGSNAIGAQGFITAIAELKTQLDDIHLKLDAIVFASSSGGTHVGMAVGLRRSQLSCQLIGISIDKEEGQTAYEDQLSLLASEVSGEVFSPEEFIVNRQYLGEGYGIVGQAEREAIALLARTEGILVDPVYTGRAFAGMVDMVKQGELNGAENILFWHTGGTPAIFAYGALHLLSPENAIAE